jgi:ferric-dicitrate binding protein FerR (iron transport regulator)
MRDEEYAEYQSLLIKFFAGEISDEEISNLKSLLESDPEKRKLFNEENELWQETATNLKLANFNTGSGWDKVSSRLGFGKNDSKSVTILSRNNFRLLVAAASIAFIFAIGGISLWITGRPSFKQIASASTKITTNEGEKASVFLADSSEIILNSGSTIQYDLNFNINDRIVKLNGEAWFNVHSNPEKPFTVQLNLIKVTATGTQFNISSFANEDRIETTLEKGAITVHIKGKDPINVSSGEQVVYFVKTNNAVVRDVETDTYTSWKENKLRFNDTPFEEVLRRVSRKYNVKFEITNRDLLNLKYTATFIDESIEDVMQMLKSVSPIDYKIYYRTSVNDHQYLKPRIVVGKKKS